MPDEEPADLERRGKSGGDRRGVDARCDSVRGIPTAQHYREPQLQLALSALEGGKPCQRAVAVHAVWCGGAHQRSRTGHRANAGDGIAQAVATCRSHRRLGPPASGSRPGGIDVDLPTGCLSTATSTSRRLPVCCERSGIRRDRASAGRRGVSRLQVS